MPTEDAYSSGHLVLSHFGTCICSNVETNLSSTCLVFGLLNFEHPSVLLFCFFCILQFHQYLRDNIHLSEAGTATLLKGYNGVVSIVKHRVHKGSRFYCGENGHNMKKCHHGEKIKCFHCGIRGHKAKHCSRR